ncbi:unnamed protein product, partial [Amoebophrya sp. A25]
AVCFAVWRPFTEWWFRTREEKEAVVDVEGNETAAPVSGESGTGNAEDSEEQGFLLLDEDVEKNNRSPNVQAEAHQASVDVEPSAASLIRDTRRMLAWRRLGVAFFLIGGTQFLTA